MKPAFLLLVLLLLLAIAASPAIGQPRPRAETTSEPRPVAESEDPVNRYVRRHTVDGLVVRLAIDGASIALLGAQPARVPRRNADPDLRGDTVTITAFTRDRAVGTTRVADRTMAALERVGVVRQARRTIAVALPTPGMVDSIEVRVSASGASQRFDVNPAYAEICRALPRAPVCAGRPAYAPR